MRTSIERPAGTDAQMFGQIRRALDNNPTVPATVRVHVDHGVITLTGSVRNAAERLTAETVARGVMGVTRIVNEISVAQQPSAEGFERPAGD